MPHELPRSPEGRGEVSGTDARLYESTSGAADDGLPVGPELPGEPEEEDIEEDLTTRGKVPEDQRPAMYRDEPEEDTGDPIVPDLDSVPYAVVVTERTTRIESRPQNVADASGGHEISELETRAEQLQPIIEDFGRVVTALRRVLRSWDAGRAELTRAWDAGRAPGLSEQDYHRVIGAGPELEETLSEVTEMRESAVSGSEPSATKTANLAAQLTEVDSVADRVQQALPRSTTWQTIRTGIKAGCRWLLQVLVSLPKAAVTGASINFGLGLPGVVKVEFTLDLSPRPPPGTGKTPNKDSGKP